MTQTTAAVVKAGARNESPSHELDAPPWLRVETTLIGAAQAIRNAYDVRLAPLGLTLSLASLLAYVADFGPVNQSRAAQHLSQGRAATGVQADRLERMGMIERRPDPDDRRVWMLAITERGRTLAGEVAECDTALRAEFRSGISRADRQQLAALLVRLQGNVAAARTIPHTARTNHIPEEPR
jgi:MarR family transcriptional regulator, transcriptional regulator for hemolysin